MQLKKVFDPQLVGRMIISLYFPRLAPEEVRNVPRHWESRAEAQKYAKGLAVGLTLWSTIDIIAALTLVFISLFVSIPLVAVLYFIAFAVGCPLIMALGIGAGCLRHLTLQETWVEIRNYFREE